MAPLSVNFKGSPYHNSAAGVNLHRAFTLSFRDVFDKNLQMSLFPPLDGQLPAVTADLPESDWIHTTSVTGPYGITASVKDWQEVMDWQEHRRNLTQGYYRLIATPQVRELTTRLEAKYPGWHAVAVSSAGLARKEVTDLLSVRNLERDTPEFGELPDALPGGTIPLLTFSSPAGSAAVAFFEDADLAAELFERNRRRGGALPGRVAEGLLRGTEFPSDPAAEQACTLLLAEWEQADHVFYYPSGMAAVTAALEHVFTPAHNRMIVLGNVYRDTHLLLEEQEWAHRDVVTDFLDTDDLEGLQKRIRNPAIAGVLVETVTNPLIEIPDLPAIADLCREAGVPLLVDSTMAGPLNAAPLALGADLVIHSTSKYLSGHNTHGGGVVLTRDAGRAEALNSDQDALGHTLAPVEFPVLLEGLSTYPERLVRFNRNGEALAELLREHPVVETVYFANTGRPDWLKGLAGVVSCELKDPTLEKVAAFFESPLPGVIKAPSLGSNQTLFCPYVLLAYYDKTDAYLRQSNLSKTLLRFAVGCEEDFGSVAEGISDALDALP